jgi:hypothetical protein
MQSSSSGLRSGLRVLRSGQCVQARAEISIADFSTRIAAGRAFEHVERRDSQVGEVIIGRADRVNDGRRERCGPAQKGRACMSGRRGVAGGLSPPADADSRPDWTQRASQCVVPWRTHMGTTVAHQPWHPASELGLLRP